ncbi:MAG: hypothetical protein HY885_14965 [Deltaproteobacteria bacterium]|nr:hypothetical protein [Deltaproteobacteria bacterium]
MAPEAFNFTKTRGFPIFHSRINDGPYLPKSAKNARILSIFFTFSYRLIGGSGGRAKRLAP